MSPRFALIHCMPATWNKGFTKATHPSVLKISRTMKRKKLDNLYAWREQMKQRGKIKARYPALRRNGDLAELMGVVLGDGHVGKHSRCEVLRILSHSDNHGFVRRYARLVESVFGKQPTVARRAGSRCTMITIYEQHISTRLGIPSGKRKERYLPVPRWIAKQRSHRIRYLRGLYEAEGSYCVHRPTSTVKLLFSNRNASLRRNVKRLLVQLGFHPHESGFQVQMSRKKEVEECRKLLQFRRY